MTSPWTFHPVAGERITLDLLRADDLEALFAIQSDPEVCRFLPYEPRTLPEVEAALIRDAAATRLERDGTHVQPAIRHSDGRLLGTIMLRLTSMANQTCEIGWVLAPSAQGHGYAAEAAGLMLEVAFGELGVHRVIANLDPRNTASAALCERLGMRREAHFVEDYRSKGEWTDTWIYAILAREHRAGPAA